MKWIPLSEDDSTADTFYGNEEKCITGGKITTFPMKQANKGFEYIRWQTTDSYTRAYFYFIASALEIYGTISNAQRVRKLCISIYRKCALRESIAFIRYLITIEIIK